MRKLSPWLWTLAVLVAANLALAVSGKLVLIRQERGQAWLVQGDVILPMKADVSAFANKRRIPIVKCLYWTGVGTRASFMPFARPDQRCQRISG